MYYIRHFICLVSYFATICLGRTLGAIHRSWRNPDTCSTGRLYLGSVGELWPEHVLYNGVYKLTGRQLQNMPMYKHETEDLYIYYLPSERRFPEAEWAASPQPGSREKAVLLSQSLLGGEWKIWNVYNNQWEWAQKVESVCVNEDFTSCTTGVVVVAGLHSRHNRHQDILGDYKLLDEIFNLRPVYFNEKAGEYLFYSSGIWKISPDFGNETGRMFAFDDAWRPEFITHRWTVFLGSFVTQDDDVTINCNPSAMVPGLENRRGGRGRSQGSNDRGGRGSVVSVLARRGGRRTNTERRGIVVATEICEDDYCHNGAVCRQSVSYASGFYCVCSSRYFGPRCDRMIDCGQPPTASEDLELITQTGQSLLDVALYRCVGNQRLVGRPGVACQQNGHWTSPPRCLSGPHRTPEQELN